MDTSTTWNFDGEDFFKGESFLWVLKIPSANLYLFDVLDQMKTDHGSEFGFSLAPLTGHERQELGISPDPSEFDEYWAYYLIATKNPWLPMSLDNLLIEPLPFLRRDGNRAFCIDVFTIHGCMSIISVKYHRHEQRLYQICDLILFPCVHA